MAGVEVEDLCKGSTANIVCIHTPWMCCKVYFSDLTVHYVVYSSNISLFTVHKSHTRLIGL